MAKRAKLFNLYRNFSFIDKDPSIDAARQVIRAEEHLTNGRAAAITGLSATTFYSWFEGGTRRPQNASLTQAMAALGRVRRDELGRDGQVHIGYVKVRDLDYQREIEKQADWLLKQRGPKPKRKRKAKGNGHG